VDSGGVQGIFDFHNCSDETQVWPELIREHVSMIRHVHLNELNGSYPGTGNSDFLPAFRALAEISYSGWVSLEVFHVPEDPEKVLSETGRFLDAMQESAGGG
jgi:sugar phosphate isomerase/epimerase